MLGVGESPTVRLSGLVSELRAKGEDVISLGVGEPDFPTPSHIVEAAKQALDEGFTKYTPSKGIPELREAIAEKSRAENGIPCGPEDVIVIPTKHALFASVLAFAGPSDEVLLPDPGWVSYLPMVRLASAKPVPVPCEGEFQMTPEATAELITPASRMIIVNSPNNPTGSVYDPEALRGLADLAEDHNLVIVTDEIYEKIVFNGEHHSIAAFPGAFDNTITVHGFSKTYSMTGWRLGWAVAPRDLLGSINKIQQHSTTCATSFAQKGGVAALTGPKGPVEKMVQEFEKRREIVAQGVAEIPAFTFKKPRGTFYAWIRYDDPRSSLDFAETLLKEAKVAVTPGIAFGDKGENHFRLSFAASRENIQEAFKRVAEVLA